MMPLKISKCRVKTLKGTDAPSQIISSPLVISANSHSIRCDLQDHDEQFAHQFVGLPHTSWTFTRASVRKVPKKRDINCSCSDWRKFPVDSPRIAFNRNPAHRSKPEPSRILETGNSQLETSFLTSGFAQACRSEHFSGVNRCRFIEDCVVQSDEKLIVAAAKPAGQRPVIRLYDDPFTHHIPELLLRDPVFFAVIANNQCGLFYSH